MSSQIKFIISLVFLSSINMFSQTDTAFWFAAPEVTAGHSDRPIAFRITSFNQSSTVKISQPANLSFNPITVNIPANNLISVDLTNYINIIENKPADSVLNYGLLIRASSPVTAYYEVISNDLNPEIFTLKGKNALGTDFVIPMQNEYENYTGYNPQPFNSFEIVATEDNTTISINPSHDIAGHQAGTLFQITLNKGQTYSARAVGYQGIEHLYGSIVTSDKAIAITMNDDSVDPQLGGCKDLTGDQIVPVDILGTEYIAIKGFLTSDNDKLFFIATRDGTSIYLNGNSTPFASINKSGIASTFFTNTSMYITSNYPINVLHVSGFGCELGSALLPPISCTGSTKVAFTRTTSEYFGLILFTRSGSEGNFTLNGSSTAIDAALFFPVPGTANKWVAASLDLSTVVPVSSASIISNSTSLFHVGIINGGAGSGCRYGYFSNYDNVTHRESTEKLCIGDTLFLKSLEIPDATYTWSGPNNFSSNENNPVIPNVLPNMAGDYHVTVNSTNECNGTTARIKVLIAPPPIADIIPDGPTTFCEGYDVFLKAMPDNPAYSYLWSTGETTPSIFAKQSGVYTVKVYVGNFCQDTASINITVLPSPNINIVPGENITKCKTSDLLLKVEPNNSDWTYLWSTGETSQEIWAKQTGVYTVTVENKYGCKATKKILVSEANSPKVQITATGPTTICEGQAVTLKASPLSNDYKYKWSTGETSPFITVKNSGTYTVSVEVGAGCKDSSSITVSVLPKPKAIITSDKPFPICEGETALLTVSPYGNDYNIEWSNGKVSESILVNESGDYYAIVENECKDTAKIKVKVNPKPKAEIKASGPTSFCDGGNVTLTALPSISGYKYKWNTGDMLSSITVDSTGFYTVYVKNEFGCEDSASIQVSANLAAFVKIIPEPSDRACLGDTIILRTDGYFKKYNWNDGSSNEYLIATQSGIYSVIVTDSNGCMATSEIELKFSQPQQVKILGESKTCNQDSTELTTDKEFQSYQWNTGDTTRSIIVTNSGNYTVSVKDSNGCQAFADFQIDKLESKISIKDIANADFGFVLLGDKVSRQFIIANEGIDDLSINNMKIKYNDTIYFIDFPSVPISIKAQGSCQLGFSFIPKGLIEYPDSLIIEVESPCYLYYSIPLNGTGISKIIAWLPDTTAIAGETQFCIPLKAKLNDNGTDIENLSFNAEISFDARAFLPETPDEGIIRPILTGINERVIKIEGKKVNIGKDNVLLGNICGTVLLFEQDRIPLKIDTIHFFNPNIFVETKNGSLAITDVCIQNYRIIKSFNPTELSIIPNPTNDEAEIIVETDETGNFTIDIYSVNGNKIKKISWVNERKGLMKQILDLKDFSSGLYQVVLRSPSNLIRSQLIITR